MGAQPSKQDNFVSFSITGNNLNLSDDIIKRLAKSNETDFSRNEESERLIENEVNKRLVQLEKQTLKNFEDQLETSLLLSDIGSEPLSSSNLDEKVQKIEDKLTRLQATQQNKLDDEGKRIKNDLLKCLLDNKGKPLNCYEYMEAFNKIINR